MAQPRFSLATGPSLVVRDHFGTLVMPPARTPTVMELLSTEAKLQLPSGLRSMAAKTPVIPAMVWDLQSYVQVPTIPAAKLVGLATTP